MSSRILALDTATEACSVALLDNHQVLATFEHCAREHTQRILPLVQQLLAEAGVTLNQLDALAFGRGPGSFTGVRIGIGIAQGLALGAGLPLIGVSTLQTMAQGAWRRQGASQVLAAIDARMGELYWAQYRRDNQGRWLGETSEAVVKPERAQADIATLSGHWTPVGTGWQAWPQLAESDRVTLNACEVTLPSAEDMLPLAADALARGATVDAEHAEPVYLRNEVAWKKLPGRE
ncbi:tRNA (adenosine(37)-N6)-threonylcarbamoyltransferase complex dimerization subunit type 1 TsaB [Erwinia sp. OLTSP20]|uniref:tRNA (adenosine(37)-N6)-threonylcarbamoyltransferase complex dimerization subunit type 1 TsaB n=1 Tax=unclassified Erwinia TaxID=2622719 RepID=UPI000C1908BA|nr:MULTISPECIES: tRNA (adenosine(37)-N6)-threonylcarbamoyltransferase complex dimerization subunit type 1 TsaB [unclassified Erwinia]PIJ51419.1 tRNA (adenosine(37)-N6)-threonylcarbamoyltransferase complex dimerization subunit type 1 TsaB [Erwinia sp. OAMSP11]PIJ73441.1 tRNA (adenosine(37)-N6)-threonylcarbamoyltransferase complex dimerization subunit type 1 TsaB [Erwinia sp. OLSSP12]PIJ85504.1 tRNA (adenosine(37)-N6)-threonylcarbamoyltransferase complex dimerization subunit type 1 TsaB [Erwinia s